MDDVSTPSGRVEKSAPFEISRKGDNFANNVAA